MSSELLIPYGILLVAFLALAIAYPHLNTGSDRAGVLLVVHLPFLVWAVVHFLSQNPTGWRQLAAYIFTMIAPIALISVAVVATIKFFRKRGKTVRYQTIAGICAGLLPYVFGPVVSFGVGMMIAGELL